MRRDQFLSSWGLEANKAGERPWRAWGKRSLCQQQRTAGQPRLKVPTTTFPEDISCRQLRLDGEPRLALMISVLCSCISLCLSFSICKTELCNLRDCFEV